MREPEFKAALIDGLFNEGMIDEESVIVSEMPVHGMSRRADIVLANGRLLAFEIKTDGDKIDRLEGQLHTYRRLFEGVAVICGNRHAEKVLNTTPEAVGVFLVEQDIEGEYGAKLLRKPHIRQLDRHAAVQHMHARDLYRLLREHDLVSPTATDRATLEAASVGLSAAILRPAAIRSIKRRYQRVYEDFAMARLNGTTAEALACLRKLPWSRPATEAESALPGSDASGSVLPVLRVTPRRVQPKMS